MHKLLTRFLLFATCICITACSQAPTDSVYIENTEREVITAWLVQQPHLRIATDEDCDCEKDLAAFRKTPGHSGYRPYYVRGDFNGDQTLDFAVALYNQQTKAPDVLVIFNGPYRPGSQPAFTSPLNSTLYFKPEHPVPHRLMVGFFFTEGTYILPKGNTYVPEEDEEQ